MVTDRLAKALELSESLLTDFEMSELAPIDVVRRASRLARLLNDVEASEWLGYEIRGFSDAKGENGKVTGPAWKAAKRSGRVYFDDEGKSKAKLVSVGQLQASADAARLQLAASADAPLSISSANPSQYVNAANVGNTRERSTLNVAIQNSETILMSVLGSIHLYVTEKNYELRFGSAVESSFTRLRSTVDDNISAIVPSATQKLAAAFELATSDVPDHWADAAGYCRKLVKEIADVLQPPSDPINGRQMGDGNYINRLVHWIQEHEASATKKDVLTSDLEFFGKRIDALADAGNKGVHATVEQRDADRFIVGTYLLISDVLRLHSPVVDVAIVPPTDQQQVDILQDHVAAPAVAD